MIGLHLRPLLGHGHKHWHRHGHEHRHVHVRDTDTDIDKDKELDMETAMGMDMYMDINIDNDMKRDADTVRSLGSQNSPQYTTTGSQNPPLSLIAEMINWLILINMDGCDSNIVYSEKLSLVCAQTVACHFVQRVNTPRIVHMESHYAPHC